MDKIALIALKKSGAPDISAAVAAKEAAQAAQEAAETAQGKAEDAAEELEGALEDIAELQSDVSTLQEDTSDLKSHVSATEIVVQTDSQPIVQIADGSANNAKSYDVQITPAQDLHGYDNPWPAGGGVNLLNADDYAVTTETGTDKTIIIDKLVYLEAGTTYTLSCRQTGNAGTAVRNILGIGTSASASAIEWETANNPAAHVHTLTYTPSESGYYRPLYWAHTLANAVTLDQFQCEKGSSFTSYAPYSNICPISGFTGIQMARTGKNLFNISALVSGGIREEVGTSLSNANWRRTPYIFLPAGKYTVSRATLDWWKLFSYTTADDSTVIKQFFNDNTHLSYTITLDTDCYIRIGFDYIPTDSDKIQLELGESATAYEPYSGSDYSVTFPVEAGTVYGGNLHVNEDGSGTLVVDKKYYALPSNANWSNYGDGKSFYYASLQSLSITDMKSGNTSERTNAVITNCLRGNPSWYDIIITNEFCFTISSDSFLGINLAVSGLTSQDVNTWISENNLTLVYPIATPQTYTLTAPQIALLLGENNLWADTGDMAVEYIADTKLYIQTLTGHPDEDMIADSNIPSGQFFMVGNRLFISTSAIASGETITPGTNCTETNLAAALNTINAD